MNKNKFVMIIALFVCLTVCITPVHAFAVTYFPGITEEMTEPEYWSDIHIDSKDILASAEEISELNKAYASVEETNLKDLKTLPETFDGLKMNERLYAGAESDKEGLAGMTYDADGNLLTDEYFDLLALNCIDPDASENMTIRYGIAVHRTALQIYPTDAPILDDSSDTDIDNLYNITVRVNEPLVIYTASADKQWYCARNSCGSGWINAGDIAVCSDREEWLNAWDFPEERTLVVYGDKVYTEDSNTYPETSGRMLTMGTVLELAEQEGSAALIINRVPWHNHVVYLPVRNPDGSYKKQEALIPAVKKVSAGYLDLTEEGIVSTAFEALGNTYGWGGMLHSEDCSGYVRSIYKCFGLEIARNTSWQKLMPAASADLSYTCAEEKKGILDRLPLGAVLFISGHEMLYLGHENENYYVVSAVNSIMNPYNTAERQKINNVIINTLDTRRANGHTWLAEINFVNIPYYSADYDMPSFEWYHDGVAFCLKNNLLTNDDEGFYPNNPAKRWEIVNALWCAAEKPESGIDDELGFTDVSSDASYYDALCWAYTAGIISGTDENEFQPDSEVTREQLAAMLCRCAVYFGHGADFENETDLSPFSDSDEISEWALPAVRWAVSEGILNGDEQSRLSPHGYTTRAQLAVILMRFNFSERQK